MFDIKEVISQKDKKRFVDFQFELYKNDEYWVAPLKNDELNQLSPASNPSFDICEAKFWLAEEDGKVVGRIGAIINHDYNKKINEKKGRINRIEFVDDKELSKLLIVTAENWLKENGMEKVHGPLGFNNFDNQGLMIEGFDHLPSIASVYHKAYYLEHLSELGYEKENDWLEFRLTLGETALKKGIRGAQLIVKRYGFEVLSFNAISELREYAHEIFETLNKAFSDLPYVSSFNDRMIAYYSEKYFKVLNPKFIKIIKKDGNIVAFIIGMPSLSKAMKKANGKLFPFGFYHLMKAMKKPEIIDLLLTGVHPDFHSSGAAVVLFAGLQEEMMKQGIDQMETTGVFETNHAVISNWKNYNHQQYKRRRCFVKSL